jgi:hypothetical protein
LGSNNISAPELGPRLAQAFCHFAQLSFSLPQLQRGLFHPRATGVQDFQFSAGDLFINLRNPVLQVTLLPDQIQRRPLERKQARTPFQSLSHHVPNDRKFLLNDRVLLAPGDQLGLQRRGLCFQAGDALP